MILPLGPIYSEWHVSFPAAAAAAAKSLRSCPTLYNPIDGSPPGSSVPGILTGVGCHFLLQRMKVKSESEVTQSCPTRSDPMDCSLPGSSTHGIFQARVLEWVAIAFSAFPVRIILFQYTRTPRKYAFWYYVACLFDLFECFMIFSLALNLYS